MAENTGQMPMDIENITFDKETVQKLMKNKSFASAVSEVIPQVPQPDIRAALLRSAGFSMLDSNALMAVAKSLNNGDSAQSLEAQIKKGAIR
jgi:hypothetical protein